VLQEVLAAHLRRYAARDDDGNPRRC
jgi:hypothetical protein